MLWRLLLEGRVSQVSPCCKGCSSPTGLAWPRKLQISVVLKTRPVVLVLGILYGTAKGELTSLQQSHQGPFASIPLSTSGLRVQGLHAALPRYGFVSHKAAGVMCAVAAAMKSNNTELAAAAMYFWTVPLHACICLQAKPLAFVYTARLDKITTR